MTNWLARVWTSRPVLYARQRVDDLLIYCLIALIYPASMLALALERWHRRRSGQAQTPRDDVQRDDHPD